MRNLYVGEGHTLFSCAPVVVNIRRTQGYVTNKTAIRNTANEPTWYLFFMFWLFYLFYTARVGAGRKHCVWYFPK